MKYSLIILLSFFIHTLGYAQFTVDFSRGCAPLTVNITDTSGADPNNVLYRIDNGNVSTSTTYTFEEEGTITITQVIGTVGGGSETTQTIEVLNPELPRFTLSACPNRGIQMQIEGGIYDRYAIDYGDGTPEEIIFPSDTPQHTYAAGTTREVTVRGLFTDAKDNCQSATQSIALITSFEAPTLSRLVMNDAGGTLEFSLPTNLEHSLEQRLPGGTYQEIARLSAGSSQTNFSGTLSGTCYQIRVIDDCTGEERISNELCTTEVRVSSASEINTVEWDIYAGEDFGFYELFRGGESLGQFGNNNITTFTDDDVVCQQEYCYQLVTTTNNGETSVSAEACVTTVATSQVLSISRFFASVEEESVVLNWDVPNPEEVASVTLEKSIQGGGFSTLPLSDSTTLAFTDNTADPTVQNCYRITVFDACGNSSEPQITCATVVSGERAGNDNFVEWTAYEGLTDFNYFLEVYDDVGELLREEGPFSPQDTNFTDLADNLEGNAQVYRIRVEDAQSDAIAFSNFHRIALPGILKVPDAFTPNGDGLNDTFQPIGFDLVEYQMQIFNRWGGIIYTTNDLDAGWNGILSNGKDAPKGPYTWVIKAEDSAGATFDEKGMLLLLR